MDDIEKHVADTLEAGAGLCDEAAVRTILSQGKPAIEWLLAQGVAFDRNHDGLHLTREGGHTCRRIAHVADYTGEAVMQSLIAQIRRRSNIRVCERQMALDVQTESGAACGLTVSTARTQETTASVPAIPYSQAAASDRFTPPPPRRPNARATPSPWRYAQAAQSKTSIYPIPPHRLGKAV